MEDIKDTQELVEQMVEETPEAAADDPVEESAKTESEVAEDVSVEEAPAEEAPVAEEVVEKVEDKFTQLEKRYADLTSKYESLLARLDSFVEAGGAVNIQDNEPDVIEEPEVEDDEIVENIDDLDLRVSRW